MPERRTAGTEELPAQPLEQPGGVKAPGVELQSCANAGWISVPVGCGTHASWYPPTISGWLGKR